MRSGLRIERSWKFSVNNPSWSAREARARLSALIDAALAGGPQRVTRRGKAAVVVISEADYALLTQGLRERVPSFIDHLLAMPRGSLDSDKSQAGRRAVD